MKKRTFILGLAALALSLGSGAIIGGVSNNFGNDVVATKAASLSAVLWDSDNAYSSSTTFTASKDGAIQFKNSAANQYSNPTRLYQSSSFSIELVSGKATTITSIVAVCESNNKSTPNALGGESITPAGGGTITKSVNGTIVTFTAEGTVTSVVFVMSGQVRVSSLTVNYENDSKTLTGISVKNAPTKAEYFEATTFDPAGLVVTVAYSDGSSEDVAYSDDTKSRFSFSPSLSKELTASDTEVTITYTDSQAGSATAAQAITVKEDAVVSLSLDGSSFEGKTFKLNGSWGTDGLVAKITRASGNINSLSIDDSGLSFTFNPEKPNSKDLTSVNLTATYEGSITASVTLSGFIVSDVEEATYDFVTNFSTYAEKWGSAYTSHSVSNTDLGASIGASISLICNKQSTGATIDDRPVLYATSGTTIINFGLTEVGYKIVEASVKFAQWSTKAPKFSMYSGAYDSSKTPLASIAISSSALTLAGNPDSDSFSVVANTKNQVGLESITVSVVKDSDSMNAANAWAQSFLDKTASSCADYNANNLDKLNADDVWTNLETSYKGLSAIAQKILNVQTANGDSNDPIEQAMARYDHIVNRYSSLNDFIGRRTSTSAAKSAFFGNSDNNGTNLAVVITFAVATAALSATFIIRKKEQDR